MIGIVGSGIIAASQAVLFTGNGHYVVLLARSEASAERCRKQYNAHFENLIVNGLVTREQVEICRKYFCITLEYEELSPAEYVFESVLEEVPVKYEVYQKLERHCKHLRALATTTSVFSVELLSEGLSVLRDKFMVAHPINPPHMVLYVEMVGGPVTSGEAMDAMASLLEGVGRKVIRLKKSAPGFIVNRLQYALFREAINIVEEGIAPPEDVDAAVRYSFAPRYTSIGPFEHMDYAGLTLLRDSCDYLFPTLCNAGCAQRTLKDKVEQGMLGCRSGGGIYDWDEASVEGLRVRTAKPYLPVFNWKLPKE